MSAILNHCFGYRDIPQLENVEVLDQLPPLETEEKRASGRCFKLPNLPSGVKKGLIIGSALLALAGVSFVAFKYFFSTAPTPQAATPSPTRDTCSFKPTHSFYTLYENDCYKIQPGCREFEIEEDEPVCYFANQYIPSYFKKIVFPAGTEPLARDHACRSRNGLGLIECICPNEVTDLTKTNYCKEHWTGGGFGNCCQVSINSTECVDMQITSETFRPSSRDCFPHMN